jgi:hypothetical protein
MACVWQRQAGGALLLDAHLWAAQRNSAVVLATAQAAAAQASKRAHRVAHSEQS